jgi:transcriptional regulator with XRE-family HTH domain
MQTKNQELFALSQKIKKTMDEQGLTQTQLAKLAGVNDAVLTRFLKDKRSEVVAGDSTSEPKLAKILVLPPPAKNSKFHKINQV